MIIDNRNTLIFSYLFTIINSSQGTIVFIFHCVLSKNVREELLKALHKKRHRMLINIDKENKTSSLLCYSASNATNTTTSTRKLHRGHSDSSSFRSPRKFFDSVKLIDRKSSNCSSTQTNSISNQSNQIHPNKKLLKNQRNPAHHRHSMLSRIMQFFCICFMSDDEIGAQNYIYNYNTDPINNGSTNVNKNIKNSQSFSTTSRTNDSSPLRNYNSSTLGTRVHLAGEDHKLLQAEPCLNCQNILCNNIMNQSYNKQVLQSQPALLQIYLTNEARRLNSQSMLYANMRNATVNTTRTAQVKRNSSQLSSCSNSSNNPTQTTYLSPVDSNTVSTNFQNHHNNYNANCNKCNTSCQIPSIPPPPLPPLASLIAANLNQYCGSDIPLSKASLLRNKDSFNSNVSDRFSTFKSSFNDKNGSTRLETPIIAMSKKLPACDENQYLQPEFHSYSMVDSEFQSESQYYCDDGIFGRNPANEEDLTSNNYVEVIEDYPEISSYEYTNKPLGNKSRNTNNAARFKQSLITNSIKLKDLIAMPEEYEVDDSVDKSNLSDQDLFNITSTVNKRNRCDQLRMTQRDLLAKIASEPNSSSSDSSSSSSCTSSSASSNFLPPHSILNSNMAYKNTNIDHLISNNLLMPPDGNIKAQKMMLLNQQI